MKIWIHAARDPKGSDIAFLNKYRSYFDIINKTIRDVAQQYDSDMHLDLDAIVEENGWVHDAFVRDLKRFRKIDINGFNLSISHALGFEAVNPTPCGVPSYFTDGQSEVEGPNGVYYNMTGLQIDLDYFDAGLERLKIAIRNYFENLQHNIETGEGETWRIQYADDYPERAAMNAGKKSSKSSRPKWSSIVSKLSKDVDEVGDPLYEQTDAGSYIESLCGEVEKNLNYYVEPSIQGGSGGVWIYDEGNDNEVVVEDYDFETFDSEIIDMALNSKNATDFKNNYKHYLLTL